MQPDVIVVLDDDPEWRELHSSALVELGVSRASRLKIFSSDEEAIEYVRKWTGRIQGYVQDIHRSIERSGSAEGIIFFDNIIKQYTPDAWLVVVSAGTTMEHMRHIFRTSIGPVDVLEKASYDKPAFGQALSRVIDLWSQQQRFHRNPEEAPDSHLIQVIAEPWRSIAGYIEANPSFLHNMSPRKFEKLIAEMYSDYGWQVDLTSRTCDGGYDIVAIRRQLPTNMLCLIEAKRYSPDRPVSVGIVRSLYGLRSLHSASQVVLATSSTVSDYAKDAFRSRTPWEIDFLERDRILEWCRSYAAVRLGGQL